MERGGQEAQRFYQAAALLPPGLRQGLERLPPEQAGQAEELRLRAGQPPTLVFPRGEHTPRCWEGLTAEGRDLELTLEIATRASVHTALEQLRSGFVTVRGGHRVGICGSAVVENGTVRSLRQISSLSIRVARQVPGAAAGVLPGLLEDGALQSTLLLSPPGGGKTTLLRDLIRMVSRGEGTAPLRVGVADERGELAAMYGGRPQLDVGPRTDVLDGCPKGTALLMLLRGMNPQVLAADEITAPEDCAALEMAANCGVKLLAAAHGDGPDDLRQRPLYRRLLAQGVFRRLVILSVRGGERRWRVEKLGGTGC